MAKPTYSSQFYTYCFTKMQNVIYFEYAVRAFRAESEKSKAFHEFLKAFRASISNYFNENIVSRYIGVPFEPIEDLKLVDCIFDYIQYDVMHLDTNSMYKFVSKNGRSWHDICEDFKMNFYEFNAGYDGGESYILANFRYADLSQPNNIEDLIKAYDKVFLQFQFFEEPENRNARGFTEKLGALKGLRTSCLLGGEAHHIVHVPDAFEYAETKTYGKKVQKTLTLKLKVDKNPCDFEQILKDFLMEYAEKKSLYYSDEFSNEDSEIKYYNDEIRHVVYRKAEKALSAVYDTIDYLNVRVGVKSPVQNYTHVIPHLLGILMLDYEEESGLKKDKDDPHDTIKKRVKEFINSFIIIDTLNEALYKTSNKNFKDQYNASLNLINNFADKLSLST